MNTLENTNMWILYRHVSPSGKVYIGITKNSPTVRWGKNGSGYTNCPIFSKAIEKYGWDNIKHEVLFKNLPELKAKQLEIDLIRHYKNLGISYNVSNGGDGFLGYCPSEKTRKIWAVQRKGRKLTSDWKKKLSESLKGRVIPVDVCKKGGAAAGKLKAVSVVQLSLDGKFIAIHESAKGAATTLGKNRGNVDIIRCCKLIKRSAYGYLWMYKSDYDNSEADGTLKFKILDLVNNAKNKYKFLKTEEHREKLRKACFEAKRKPILQLSSDGAIINVFDCMSEAQRLYGYDVGFIASCCKGKYNKAYGYKWKYISKGEYEQYKNQLSA